VAAPETIVFAHGIWMPGRIMSFLKHRLEREHGFAGRLFSYYAVQVGLDENAARLSEFVSMVAEGPVHVVGHSLGGVLALRMHALHPDAPAGRIVCLGSPLCGSRAAVGLGRWRWGQRMLGRTITAGVVDEAADCWGTAVTARREVGIIAGTTAVGVGKLMAVFDEANDGTVSVAETRLPGARDHLLMPVTHTGLVWSRPVADQVAAFLRRGEFLRDAAAGLQPGVRPAPRS
jgi:pimeloyl-ACP methyl ester carboxylesterase